MNGVSGFHGINCIVNQMRKKTGDGEVLDDSDKNKVLLHVYSTIPYFCIQSLYASGSVRCKYTNKMRLIKENNVSSFENGFPIVRQFMFEHACWMPMAWVIKRRVTVQLTTPDAVCISFKNVNAKFALFLNSTEHIQMAEGLWHTYTLLY